MCSNYNNKTGFNYSINVNMGNIRYKYSPVTNMTTTITSQHIIKDYGNGIKSTISLPQLPTPTTTPSLIQIEKDLQSIQGVIDTTTQSIKSSTQHLNHISGVSGGDVMVKTPIILLNGSHMVSPDVIIDSNILDLVNCAYNTCADTRNKCKNCSSEFINGYLKENKLYFCPLCATGHVFSPFNIDTFGPFKDEDELYAVNKTIMETNKATYEGHVGFWRN